MLGGRAFCALFLGIPIIVLGTLGASASAQQEVQTFVRGDVNASGASDLTDVFSMLNYFFFDECYLVIINNGER